MVSDRPVIVVAAYNRPEALERLLRSLGEGWYGGGEVGLVISVDGGGERGEAVRRVAREFEWAFGWKEVIAHEGNLGLMGNVFFCGRLAKEYGAVVLLEDDLVVARPFYLYAVQALRQFGEEAAVGGISLNALSFNGYTHEPFVPYLDGSDGFFMQVAWYQGQVYTAAQWQAFDKWLAENDPKVGLDDGLHESFTRFPETDWFPIKMKYLVQSGKYYVFPRTSLTTNFGDVGTHFSAATQFFQVALEQGKREWRFRPFDEALAVYDSFHEMLPSRLSRLVPQLQKFSYDVDLYGRKGRRHLQREYVLTSKKVRQAEQSYGRVMWPHEANVIADVAGTQLSLCRGEMVDWGWGARMLQRYDQHRYFARYRRIGGRTKLLWQMADLLRRVGFWPYSSKSNLF